MTFCALGFLLGLERMDAGGGETALARILANLLVYATAILCVIRAVPVVWDGRRCFLALVRPAE